MRIYHNRESLVLVSFDLYFLLLQVSSATATFAMTFSSSMSVVEYYLLKRFPIPYGEFTCYIMFDKTVFLTSGCLLLCLCSSVSCGSGNNCSFGWTTCSQKTDSSPRPSIPHHLHPRLHDFYQRHITWYMTSLAHQKLFL